MKPTIIDIYPLLDYFNKLSKFMDQLYPEKLTWDNIYDCKWNIDYKHPYWVKAHFPLVLIYHRENAGKLRDAKKQSIMFQNNYNVLTQVIWTADAFGTQHKKNKHKGFKNIVAAIKASEKDFVGKWKDRQPPKRFKNFEELYRLTDPGNIHFKALCMVLSEDYKCDSIGQLKLL